VRGLELKPEDDEQGSQHDQHAQQLTVGWWCARLFVVSYGFTSFLGGNHPSGCNPEGFCMSQNVTAPIVKELALTLE
jgi:hypothetical protein